MSGGISASPAVKYVAHTKLRSAVQNLGATARTALEAARSTGTGTAVPLARLIDGAIAATVTKFAAKVLFWVLVFLSFGFYYLWIQSRVNRLAADGGNPIGRAFLALKKLSEANPPGNDGDPPPKVPENQLEELCQLLFEADNAEIPYDSIKTELCHVMYVRQLKILPDLGCLIIAGEGTDGSNVFENFFKQFNINYFRHIKLYANLGEHWLQWNMFIAKAAQLLRVSMVKAIINYAYFKVGDKVDDRFRDIQGSVKSALMTHAVEKLRAAIGKKPLCDFVRGEIDEVGMKPFVEELVKQLVSKLQSSVAVEIRKQGEGDLPDLSEKFSFPFSASGEAENRLCEALGIKTRDPSGNLSRAGGEMKPIAEQVHLLLGDFWKEMVSFARTECTFPCAPQSDEAQVTFTEFIRMAGEEEERKALDSGSSFADYIRQARTLLAAAQAEFDKPLEGSDVDVAAIGPALEEAKKFWERVRTARPLGEDDSA